MTTPTFDSEPSILIVADDDDIRDAIGAILAFKGYRVVEAGGGRRALEILRGGLQPFLILLDLMMPNMSGGELAEELLRIRPEMKFLFVSGYAGRTVLDHKVMDVETNFLQKPYTLKQLSYKIRAALDPPASASEKETPDSKIGCNAGV